MFAKMAQAVPLATLKMTVDDDDGSAMARVVPKFTPLTMYSK